MSAKGVNRSENLIRRTRKLIDGYPKNSILKEFLQNADDSKSTELVVTFDARIHSFQSSNLDFSPAKGPALLIYNDSKFKERDFDAIVQIGAEDSKQNNADATGRFGEGFNSSFSISDHPSFISNGRAYWFDILREAVSKDANTPDTQYWDEEGFDEIQDWLKTFSCSKREQITKGTIFRLPLRTIDTKSKISHEVFSRNDFLEWVDEWKSNASHLIFLRHIQKLVLREVDTEGNLTVHLEIVTKNKEDIGRFNNVIQNEFKGDFLDICNNWKNTENELPFFKYQHHFEVSYLNRTSNLKEECDESWAVVNGLFRGENNCLIKQAIKALEIKPESRKVWPWAGVAIQLDSCDKVHKSENSKFFTFLPLPLDSKHPVHIHGGFDLNSERNQITKGESGKDLEKLTEWNRLLFKEGVGVAWANLIDFIKESCESQRYYSLWPSNHDEDFDEYLLEGFYKEITKFQCFKTNYKKETRWGTPKDNIYFFQYASNKNLFHGLKEHFSIISPKPTQKIIDGLCDIGTDLDEITPEFIRVHLNELSDELEFPIVLEDMPIAMLSKKEWFLSILSFCAEAGEDRDYSLLGNLPLELACNNKVYRIGENTLLDSNPKLRILNNEKSLFLHPEIISVIKEDEVLPKSWLKVNLKNYLTVLHQYIGSYDRKNKGWVKSLVNMITMADESEVYDAIKELHELEVIYLSDGTFACLKVDKGSAVLIAKEEIQNIDFLSPTGIQLVHPEYIDIYRPLLNLSQHKLITDLNAYSLIKHLVWIDEDGYEFFRDKDTREYLVDLIAQDITWMDELTDDEKGWLNEMPFIATESGNVYAKSDERKLFLSEGFQPPKHISNLRGGYEIINIVDDKQRAMYKKMGFDEQNPVNYLNQIIIPYIENSPSRVDVINISEWLANNWGELIKDIGGDKGKKLICMLSESKIVSDADGNLNKATHFYSPSFFEALPAFLRNEQYSPLKFEDSATQNNWSDLLLQLGVSTKIIPEHIVNKAQSIVEDENYEDSIALLNYISNHFEWFEELEYDGKNIFKHLSNLAWLPAEKPKNSTLSPKDEYKKLRIPSELILKNDYMIAGGAHYVFSHKVNLGKKDEDGRFAEKDIAKRIGLLVTLPDESVFESFRRLQVSNNPQYESKMFKYAKEFYKYLGRSRIEPEEIPDDVKEKSIFIKGQWRPSSKVFQTPIMVTGIDSWGEIIAKDGQDSKLAKGLIKLGVLDKPNNEYLVRYLRNLPQNQKLNKQQLKDAKEILTHLQENIDELGIDDIPILSRSDQLGSSDLLYIKDLAAYDKSDNKNDQLEFSQHQFFYLARHCNVVSLTDAAIRNVDKNNSKFSEGADNFWSNYIRDDAFKSAVLRLIYHEGKISDDEIKQESLDEVLPSHVRLMDSLIVRCFINDTWIYDDKKAKAHQDIEKSVLYLLKQENDEDICESITCFVCDSSDLKRESYGLIGRILRNKLETTEDVHDLLDEKNIKSLPDEIEINESLSIYGTDEPTEMPGQGGGDSTDNNSDEKRSINQAGEAIPPPTKPKRPASSNEKSEGGAPDNRKGPVDNATNGANSAKGERKTLGLNSAKEIVSSNDRKPVFVGREKEVDPNEKSERQNNAIEIGNKGENYVLEHSMKYLLSELNTFVKAPVNNMGFDISEIDPDGEIVRYVEVKTLSGAWGEGGVGVTVPQIEFAQAYDNWWLFVVENINTQNTTVHTFKNPIQQANRFMFDHSWRQLAETAKNNHSLAPEEGGEYLL